MRDFIEPRVIVSRCLGFENCRYNGQIISSEEVQGMKEHIDFITICPENDIGLGVPRDSLRLVSDGDNKRLVQPKTGNDYTEKMEEFLNDFFSEKTDLDGFILKSKSPSCGLKEAKIYPEIESRAPIGKSPGLFGSFVLEHFSYKAIETEGRLRNYQIREHFLTKIFTFADFRDRRESKSLDRLKEFHEHNRLLFRSYNEDLYQKMNEALKENVSISELYDRYEKYLYELLNTPPDCESKIRIIEEIFEEMENKMEEDEIDFFRESLEDYRKGKTSFNVPLSILYTWLLKFKDGNSKDQSFFYPYPRDLVRLEDIRTCLSRDYWNF